MAINVQKFLKVPEEKIFDTVTDIIRKNQYGKYIDPITFYPRISEAESYIFRNFFCTRLAVQFSAVRLGDIEWQSSGNSCFFSGDELVLLLRDSKDMIGEELKKAIWTRCFDQVEFWTHAINNHQEHAMLGVSRLGLSYKNYYLIARFGNNMDSEQIKREVFDSKIGNWRPKFPMSENVRKFLHECFDKELSFASIDGKKIFKRHCGERMWVIYYRDCAKTYFCEKCKLVQIPEQTFDKYPWVRDIIAS